MAQTSTAMGGTSDRSWMTLRIRALIGLAVVAVLLPALGGWIGISSARHALIGQVERGQLTTARSLASEVQQSFGVGVTYLRGVANGVRLQDAVARHDVALAQTVLKNVVDIAPYVRTAAVYIGPRRPLARYPLRLTSPEADVTTSATSKLFDAMPYGEDAILTLREPVVSRGKTVGFLVAEISFRKAAPTAQALRFGSSGVAMIVDKDGHILISGDRARTGAALGDPEPQRLIAAFKPGTLHYFSSLAKRRELQAFVPVKGFPWGLVVSQAESEALGPISQSVRALVLGLLFLIVVGLAITLLVVQAFDRYERRLSERLLEQERLNRALEGFSRHVAHDLRTPIAVIQLASQTVDREVSKLSDGAKKAAGMIGRQAERASELVEDLLDLARASGTPKLESFDLEEIVKEGAHDVQGLDLRIDRPLAVVVADRASLRQAIANLLQNATRYATTNGTATVTVSCTAGEGGWSIDVADRGPGLPEGGDQKMFEPFTRGGARPTEHGSGLGLAIVAATAQAHGGRAWYEPRPGGGSLFRMYIPRQGSQPAPPTADQPG